MKSFVVGAFAFVSGNVAVVGGGSASLVVKSAVFRHLRPVLVVEFLHRSTALSLVGEVQESFLQILVGSHRLGEKKVKKTRKNKKRQQKSRNKKRSSDDDKRQMSPC